MADFRTDGFGRLARRSGHLRPHDQMADLDPSPPSAATVLRIHSIQTSRSSLFAQIAVVDCQPLSV